MLFHTCLHCGTIFLKIFCNYDEPTYCLDLIWWNCYCFTFLYTNYYVFRFAISVILFISNHTAYINTLLRMSDVLRNVFITHIEGILPKAPYLPFVSMAGRALLSGYHRYALSRRTLTYFIILSFEIVLECFIHIHRAAPFWPVVSDDKHDSGMPCFIGRPSGLFCLCLSR